MAANRFSKGYNSFSGVDIKGVFANQVIAELQAISYSITREKAPLYTMGSADPRSFSRGKRGIAGTLIFIVFDRHALLGAFGTDQPLESNRLLFLSDVDDIRPDRTTNESNQTSLSTVLTGTALGVGVAGSESALTSVGSDQEVTAPWFADQIPPFDITLAAANEYGSLAVMSVVGAEILNEGYGVSIDDIVSEQQMTYVARTIVPWHPVEGASDVRGRTISAALEGGGENTT
jgi:hypothetical protein